MGGDRRGGRERERVRGRTVDTQEYKRGEFQAREGGRKEGREGGREGIPDGGEAEVTNLELAGVGDDEDVFAIDVPVDDGGGLKEGGREGGREGRLENDSFGEEEATNKPRQKIERA